MKNISWMVAGLAVAIGLSVQAGDSPLEQVSQDADVVVRIRAFDATVAKVAELANEVQPGTGDLVSQNATMFGLVLSNPALAGVDRSKDFYLVLFARPEGEPKALFAIPTTDGPALQKGLPENYESEVRESWVFYATRDHGIPAAVSEGESLHAALARTEARELVDESDISVLINLKHLKEVYAPKIQEGREKLDEQLQKGLGTPGVENAAGAVRVLQLEAQAAFQVLDDAETLAIGITASKEGLSIEDFIDFKPDSETARFLSKHPTSKFASLSKLESGLPVYFGLSADLSELARLSTTLTEALYQDSSVQEAFKEYITDIEKTPIESMVGSFDVAAGAAGLLRTAALVETKSSTDLLASFRKMIAAKKSVKIGEVTSETTLEQEAETIGTHKIDIMTVKQQMDPKAPGAAMQAMINGFLFGPAGVQSRVTALADGFLQTQGGGKPAMEAALKAYEAKENSLDEAREGVDEEAHLLLLIDLPGLVSNGLIAATSIPAIPLPIKKEAVEELKIERSYIATAAVGDEHSLSIQVDIPVEQFQGAMKLVNFFQQMQKGGR